MNFLSWLLHNIFHPMFWFQPIFYTVHGWLATEMALWMLFHPYEPKYFPGTKLKLPFTPGIFPRGRHKLSIAIADTITEMLLTQEDIKKQAEKLITEENIFKTLDLLFNSVGTELKDISHIRRIYRYIDDLMPQFLQKVVNDYIIGLESGSYKHFNSLLDQFLNRLLPKLKLSSAQADLISRMVFNFLITPSNMRQILIEILTTENIAILESAIKGKVGGVQGLIMHFLDIKKGLQQFRHFLVDEPDDAETAILQIMDRLGVHEKLKQQIMKFSPQLLPVETVEDLKNNLIESIRRLLINYREEITEVLCGLSGEATHSITNSLMHIDYNKLTESWLPGFKRDLARFIYTYLNKELENMLSIALPAISLNSVIIEKIDQFSAQQLEETIQRICHRELRWLAFLGGFLGFWLGLVSNMVAYWWQPAKP